MEAHVTEWKAVQDGSLRLYRHVRAKVDTQCLIASSTPVERRTLSLSRGCSRGRAGHLETVQLLLKRRADPRATNRKGETPLDMARDDAIREAVTAALATPPPSAKPASKEVRPSRGLL